VTENKKDLRDLMGQKDIRDAAVVSENSAGQGWKIFDVRVENLEGWPIILS
jgi:hypothetical protein